MTASVLSTELKEQLSCSICCEVYTDPKTLQCLHSFCLPCLNELAVKTPQGTPLQCPECREDINLPPGATFETLPNSFYFNRLLELLAIKEPQQVPSRCDSCERNLPLESLCFVCGHFLCCECLNAHKLLKVLKEHRCVVLEQFKEKDIHDFLERPSSCSVEYHEQEVLDYFCEDCNTCICQKCASLEHKLHQYTHIKKAADKCKAAMVEAVDKVKAKAHKTFVTMEEDIKTASGQVHEQGISEFETLNQREKRRHEMEWNNLEQQLTKLTSGAESGDAVVKRNLTAEIISSHDSDIKLYQPTQIQIKNEASKDFDVTAAQPVPGCVVLAGLPDPTHSTAEGKGLREAADGAPPESVVTTRDSQGNICPSEADCVSMAVESSKAVAVVLAMQNQKDGHYTVQYTPRNVGSYEEMVQITGQTVVGSPLEVRVNKREYKPLKTFGSNGRGAGQLHKPLGIGVSSKGEIAVADSRNHRIQLFTSDGQYLRAIGSKDTGNAEMKNPKGVTFDQYGRVIVADTGNDRIQILTTDGQFIKQFGAKELKEPYGVCLTGDGNIAVCSGGGKANVKVFTQDGDLVMQFNDSKTKGRPYFVTYAGQKFFVTYHAGDKVSVFDEKGEGPLYSFGESGQRNGQFDKPCGVVIDSNNKVLVCDYKNHRIQVFTTEGRFLHMIGTRGVRLGQFTHPVGIAVSPTGHLYVCEEGRDRVQVFQLCQGAKVVGSSTEVPLAGWVEKRVEKTAS